MRTEIIKITPELASEFLRKNMVNRTPNDKRVKSYAEDMKAGRWQENGESIKFNVKGDMIDGQHRLMAIIKSGVTVKTAVTYDISDEVSIMDRGRNRSTTDTLLIGGLDKSLANNMMIGVVRFHFAVQSSKTNVSDFEIEDFLVKHEETFIKISQLSKQHSGGIKMKQQPVRNSVYMLAMFYALDTGVDFSKIQEFTTIVRTGFYSDRSQTAAVVCRNDMLAGRIVGNGGSLQRKNSLFKIEKAVDDFVHGRERTCSYNAWTRPIYSKIWGDRNNA